MATSPTFGHPGNRRGGLWPVDPRVAETPEWLGINQLLSIQHCYWCGPFLPKSSCSPWDTEQPSWVYWQLSVWWMDTTSGKALDPGSRLIILTASEKILICPLSFLWPVSLTLSCKHFSAETIPSLNIHRSSNSTGPSSWCILTKHEIIMVTLLWYLIRWSLSILIATSSCVEWRARRDD